jgi:cytochrome c2
LIIIILAISMDTNGCKENKAPKEIKYQSNRANKTRNIYINLNDLLQNEDRHNKALNVNVKYDHYFKSNKRYKGYLITTLLDSIAKQINFDTSNAIVIFECIDGYKPVMDWSKIFSKTKGYIVFKDLDPTINGNWADSINKKFSPYYLVWDNVKEDDNSFMWPYGLIGLRLTYNDIAFKAIYPIHDASLIKGFNLYRNNCLKCHSINKTGGTMGPEFNIPRNITEYWEEKDIVAFAKNPKDYRYNSQMPPIRNINNSDYKQIILYIKYMKNYKIKW